MVNMTQKNPVVRAKVFERGETGAFPYTLTFELGNERGTITSQDDLEALLR
jgi:hypothetical protein